MKSIENKINESKNELDSLIKKIQKEDKSIKIDEVPFASNIKKTPYTLKRSAEEIMILSEESVVDMFNIIKSYTLSAFSTDHKLVEEIKKRLEIKPNEDWFFDLNLIVNEIKKISLIEGFEVDQSGILVNIHNYIGAKIIASIIKKFSEFKDNEPISVERIRNYKDTLKKAERENRKIIQNKDVENNEQVLALAEKVFEDDTKDNFQKLQAFAKGNCEPFYFPKIFNDYIATNTKSKVDKLLLVYDLFSLVIRDKQFYSEDEFNTSQLTYKNYDAYKKGTIRNILSLK